MNTRVSCSLLLSLIFSSLCFSTVAGQEKAEILSVAISNNSWARTGEQSKGLCGGCLIVHSDLPAMCFGLTKRHNEDAAFLYLLLVRVDPKELNGGLGTSSQGPSRMNLDSLKGGSAFEIGEKQFSLKIDVAFDPDTQRLVRREIEIEGTSLQQEGPRVFLLDLTGEKPRLEPVDVKLTSPGPDMSKGDARHWLPTLQAAVDQLKQDSPRIKEHLESK